MIEQELLISIIFRILNTLLLLGIGAYLFRRYFFKKLKDRYTEYKETLKQLRAQTRMLAAEQKDLVGQIADDTALCSQLKKRITMWHRAVNADLAIRSQEHAQCATTITQRLAEQERQFTLETTEKEIMPEVLHKLHRTMTEKFSDQTMQQQYLQRIVRRLQKR